MIAELTVENLAIIGRAELRLSNGFTALTGETGGGKSLLIDAVQLALGGRADSDQVRTGAAKAVIEMRIDVTSRPDLRDRCLALGVPVEGGVIEVRREVLAEGKSLCRVGGKAIPVAALKQLGTYLVDLHGQHDHQSLLDPERHLEYLDGWIGEPAIHARAAVIKEFEAVQSITRKLNALRHGRREMEQRIDLLRYQIEEIQNASPVVGETEELESRLDRLRYAEKLSEASLSALMTLGDQEGSAYDLAADALKHLEAVARYDGTLEGPLEMLRGAAVGMQEAIYALRNYAEGLDADPAQLDAVQERLELLKTLKRKYGDDERAGLDFLARAQEELDGLTFGADDEDSLAESLNEREAALSRAAAALTSLRKERAVAFGQHVQDGMRDLAMDRAIFEVAFRDAPIDASGADRVEFYFSANSGEPARPLAKIASGGELSRVMLAIKSVYAGRAGVPTLIFDEVDSGLSGRAAVAVARKLETLALHYQVLVISHLPQIASRARRHFRIEKLERDGRIVTEVKELSPEDRELEIARMLAGEAVTEAALVNARTMLAEGSHLS